MVKKISTMLLLMTAIAVSSLFLSDISAKESKNPTEREAVDNVNGAIVKKQEFAFKDGTKYWAHQVTGQEDREPYVINIPIQGNSSTMMFRSRAYDAEKKPYWKAVTLDQVQTLPLESGFLETEGRYIWLGKPITYVSLGRATIEEKPEMALPIEVKQTDYGVELEIKLPTNAGHISEMWALDSRDPLVPWGEQSIDNVWLKLDVTEKAKWLYDGYYYKSPSTYEPTSDTSFWRIPENYVLRSFLFTGGSKAAQDMGYVMLKASLKQQEPEGYWKTQPRSMWLSDDFGIPEGFYDTRFNTGAAEMMLRGCSLYQEQAFCQSAQKYTDYFHKHAAANHYLVDGVQQGWLVADYATATNPTIQTHVSLNHQLAEINYLYKSYLQFGDRTDKDLADAMLYGVVNLGAQWILGNGDLHYAYYPDGTFGRPDYPFLTYNDLVETQRLYRQLHGMDEMTIAMLIDSKLTWMKLNNVQYQ